ncbi:hypothetical protein PHLGIDRAFT_19001, partial [Phlebiopsis gigantea 11061_1 CR5-6]
MLARHTRTRPALFPSLTSSRFLLACWTQKFMANINSREVLSLVTVSTKRARWAKSLLFFTALTGPPTSAVENG